jgi:hypothetical protein
MTLDQTGLVTVTLTLDIFIDRACLMVGRDDEAFIKHYPNLF